MAILFTLQHAKGDLSLKRPLFISLCLLLTLVVSPNGISQPLQNFGDNPGQLSGHLIKAERSGAPLVLILHGCEQDALQFAKHSGFAWLAANKQFNLLLPQQAKTNNIKRCFNWFSPQDTDKDSGEMLSLKNMLLHAQQQTQSTTTYIIGLSAGGAMASAMMIHYPEMFKSAAIIGGLAYPCADTLTKAISCMRSGPAVSPKQLAQQVNAKGSVQWPSLSVWTGDNDEIVNPVNAQAITEQWIALQQLSEPAKLTQSAGYRTQTWYQQDQPALQLVRIENLGHGFPVKGDKPGGGTQDTYLLPSPISAAIAITNFWQI
ncbi:alpha/beta hydrolase family esterase [Shewanella waksmanii]|uniref:extracellular catalytic domain type 1 short-chain-length polyhydroxyalkanoate depolymerase n=1 Tax=Shewanella waksmanii TaxID=213783 RepID=UPI00373560B0